MKTLSDLDIINTPDDTGIVWVQDPTASIPIDRRWPVSSIKALMVNTLHPVGSQYHMVATVADNDPDVAFPASKRPEALWPGTTWALLWDDAGVFFRTEGGSHTAGRTDGLQEDQMQGHWHTNTNSEATPKFASPIGVANGGVDGWGRSTSDGTDRLQARAPVSDGTNGTPRTGAETRPVNRLIRIYERTA